MSRPADTLETFERNPPYAASPEGIHRPFGLDVGVLPSLADRTWQMSFGERLALEGILTQVRPQLAVEVGTAQGGSLARIAAHSAEVHSIDLTHDPVERTLSDNVHFLTGSSHDLLGPLLERFAGADRTVDFILIDGDHSYEGIAADLATTLRSPVTGRTAILVHDTMNAEVRAGMESVAPADWEKVVYYEPDLVPGYLFTAGLGAWGGLGLILTDHRRSAAYADPRQRCYVEPFAALQAARGILRA